MIGTEIGNYRLLRQLGEGGMGVVYLAEHALLGRRAAIKVLLPSLSAREDVINRFFNEARAATSIGDPGIVQVFDFGHHTDGSAYLVMELLEGEALDQRLSRHHHLAPADALRIARQIATTLGVAHAKGIIHRDLKPENVFLVRDPEVAGGERAKILDFGIAKLTASDGNLSKTRTGALMGTPIYMSPEQCNGASDLDHRSDIYALGCVLNHLLTGRPPFVAAGLGELLGMHMIVPAPAPSTFLPGLPPQLDELVLRCLAKRRGDRFGSMAEIAAAIDAVLAGVAPTSGGGWRTPVPPPPGAANSAGSWPGPPPVTSSSPGSWPGPAPGPITADGVARSRTPTTLGSAAATIAAPITTAPAPRPSSRRALAAVAAALTLVVVGGGVWWRVAATQSPDPGPEDVATLAVGALALDAGVDAQHDAAVDAAVDGPVAPVADRQALPPIAAPMVVAPAGPASPPQRRDRLGRRTTEPSIVPPPPESSTPPPARPGCKLDDQGVPLERC